MMEALCSGCAVITTGSGGAWELAESAGLPVFPKDHPPALSQLLAGLLSDRIRIYEIAKRGQNAVLRDFTFERMMAQLMSRFETLARGVSSNAPRDLYRNFLAERQESCEPQHNYLHP